MSENQFPKDQSNDGQEAEETVVAMGNDEIENPETDPVMAEEELEATADDLEVLEARELEQKDPESVLEQIEFQVTDKEIIEDEKEEEIFVDQEQLVSIIESLLFATDKPLSINSMAQVFVGTNIKKKQIRSAVEDLMGVYADVTRGVTLEEVSGGYQLRTKIDNANFLKRLNKVRPFRLSGPALEVMAIIAYKQPIIKSEVDQIRGVESGHLVRALMEKGLVCFCGKSELPGKPMQYGTSRKFLDIFGLRNLKELPSLAEIEELLPDGIGDEEDEEVLSDITDHLAEEAASTYSEGQEELEKIVDQINSIDTSTEFFEEEKRRQRDKRDRDRAANLREAIDLGELVEDKDMKWLQRYEEKLAEIQAEKEAQESAETEIQDPVLNIDGVEAVPMTSESLSEEESGETSGLEVEREANFTDEIQALSEESFQEKQLLPDDESEELSVVSIEEALFADSDTDADPEISTEDEEETSDEELDQFLGLGDDKDNPSD